MRKLSFLVVLAAASFSVAAQQPERRAPGAEEQKQNAETPASPAAIERARTEGAAGGTASVPDEKRKAVGAGAGPHRSDTLPSPQKLPRDKPVEPAK